MRLLLDECVHPAVASLLRDGGHDVATVAALGMVGATDVAVLSLARDQERVVVTLDTDFGELLARSGAARPSVILLRRADHQPTAIAAATADVLTSSGAVLLEGALAVVGERTVRLRELPLTT